ncbi:hypothetical protein [Melghirimyces algeriensis]|uniref:Uncharacterized protein n=1 Tax=Melghirimyces algeriensis TaxID=910412 RepID=A0A521CU48_9BACL|nr:hypothetical protein [Melghirimyces algeriensis]SMO62976.1 hypothetical protein SAMN06264849_104189 [Melghirimyces algeriensis]
MKWIKNRKDMVMVNGLRLFGPDREPAICIGSETYGKLAGVLDLNRCRNLGYNMEKEDRTASGKRCFD